jgi:hypothetical protein
MKRSKLLSLLALFYLVIGGLSLLAIAEASSRDGLYLAQAVIAVVLELALAIGLFLHRLWSIPLFIVGAIVLIILNWFWLRANPPVGMFWGTKWLIAVVFNIFPGVLMFLRRSRLHSGISETENGEVNA